MVEDAGFTQVLCWNQFSPFHHTTEADILNLLNFPTNANVIKQAGEKGEEIKAKIVEKLRN